MVHDQGDEATGRPAEFEGAFSFHGVVHHVTTKDSYLRNKLEFDPQPEQGPDTGLVIFRDSDMVSVEEEEALRTGKPLHLVKVGPTAPAMCAHDRLGYNVDINSNPVLRFGAGLEKEPKAPWYDPLGFSKPDPWSEAFRNTTKVIKRQGDAQGGDQTSK